MILSAPLAATSSPPEHPLLRRTAERSLAVTCKSYAAVHRKRGGAKSFRGDSPNYNTTNPQTWTLTSVGDWSSWNNFSTTAVTRTHGAAHELTRIGSGTTPATILYDTKGNITQNQRTPGTSSTYQNYVWDFNNRMMSAVTNGANTADVTFEYDAIGRRVARTQGATAVVYIHAGQQVVCDYTRGANANTTPAFRYVWGDYIDEPILRQTGSSTLLYYHHNQQYSTVALTSASGLVVTRYGYTAYGDQTILSHSGASQTYATYSSRISYSGRDWDDSLKAHCFRARWYDAVLGRFVNRDLIGYVDGMSLYRGYFSTDAVDFLGQMVIRQIKDTFSVIFVDDLDGGDGVNVASGEQILKKAESWAAKMQNPGCVIKSLRKIEHGCEGPFELHHSYGVPETACVDFAAIFDHGSKRGPWFGDHHWNPRPTDKTTPVVPEKWSEDICGLLCDNATVFLLGCKVGLSEYPQELADRCGRDITVYACPTNCGGWGRPIGDPTLNCPDGIDEYKKGMAKKKIGGKHPGNWVDLLSQVNPIGCSKKP